MIVVVVVVILVKQYCRVTTEAFIQNNFLLSLYSQGGAMLWCIVTEFRDLVPG